MSILSLKKSAFLMAICASSGSALSQAPQLLIVDPGASTGAAQRSMEEAQKKLPFKSPSKPIFGGLMDFSDASSLERLDSISIKGELLRPLIEAYWIPFMGQSVSTEEMIAFKTWLNDTAKSQGFMAYAQTEADGNTLSIALIVPRINTIKIFATDQQLASLYLNDLNARFEADFKPGTSLDILALEHKLDAVSFTLPLELDVIIRSAGPELLDLVVNVARAQSKTGQILSSLVQVNNHGLYQFGKAQALGQLSIGGHSASSRLTLTGQKSQGITYARSEYDMPLELIDARFHAAIGFSESEGIRGELSQTRNQSTDFVLGLEKILGHQRDVVFKGVADVSTRQSKSKLSANGAELNHVQDHQLRLRVSADTEHLSSEPLRAELGVVVGHYAKLVNYPKIPEGSYSKVDFSLRKQFNLSHNGQWYGLIRLRGQHANQHVDGMNQISLGGANGVRAYSTADGLGNHGLLGTLELNYKQRANEIYGIFYDGGLVRSGQKPLNNLSSEAYALQALGVQASGNLSNWYYNVTLAKGFGGNKGALPTDRDSQPNNSRLNASFTYLY